MTLLAEIAALELSGDEPSTISQPEVEGEVQLDATVSLMQTPPGPLKSSARLYYRQRPRNGPCNESGNWIPEDAS